MSRRRLGASEETPIRPGADPGGHPGLIEIYPDLVKKIINSVRMGNYIAVAARQFGVQPRTVQAWIAKGIEDEKSIYGVFSHQLDQALAEAEARDLASVDSHANGRAAVYERDENGKVVLDKKGMPIVLQSEIKSDWKAALAKLERRNRKRWGVTDLAQSASEQELPPTRDVTPDQKNSVLNEVRSVIEALDELEGE